MDKKTIRKEIIELINSIKDHSDNFADREQIPQLELELILHKIEKLYQKSIVFNHLNSYPGSLDSPPIVEKKPIQKPEEPVVLQPVKQPPVEEKPVDKPVDLFGAVVEPAVTKTKVEKKVEVPAEPVVQEIKKTPVSLQKPMIEDIRSAIGINDKFRFINQLFGGTAQEYEIAIHQLNTSGNYDSALEYFSSLQQLYNWDGESDSVKDLFDLVERRYAH